MKLHKNIKLFRLAVQATAQQTGLPEIYVVSIQKMQWYLQITEVYGRS